MSLSASYNTPLQGRVLKYFANRHSVEVLNNGVSSHLVVDCSLKGLLKKEGTEVLVGDFVTMDSLDLPNGTARIIEVLPRRNELSRPKIANVDQVIIVHPLREPDFDHTQLDRYLTHVSLAGLMPVVCISKCDLTGSSVTLEDIRILYQDKLGFRVIFTSVHQPDTINTFRYLIEDRLSVLAGLSGAGKSTLINALNPDLNLKVGEVSEKIERGQHTTRHVELVEIEAASFIADTPGFSNLKFDYVEPIQLEAVFPDFDGLRGQCAFHNCLHRDEEGCAIISITDNQTVLNAKISQSRYQSYRDMLAEAETFRQESKSTSRKDEFGYKTLNQKGKEELKILRLSEKQREGSRRTSRQKTLQDWESAEADDNL